VGIGAYDPWVSNHATPEQAAEMARQAGARAVLPMHHSTFKLSYEPMGEPMERFRRAVPEEQIAVSEVGGEWRT
jgi:L-ascorbate metabolism protein UlaG (beta-lactamase superfamily)